MVQSCLPFLMFQGEGAAALDFYLATFPEAQAEEVERYGEGEAVPAGGLKGAQLVIAGQAIRLFDSPPGMLSRSRRRSRFSSSATARKNCGGSAKRSRKAGPS